MEDLIRQVVSYLRAAWRYRWAGLIVSWVVGAAAAIFIMTLPDRYEASARIFVDTQTVLKPLMAGIAVQPNVEQQVAMLSRTLISRPNVEKLIRMTDLDHRLKTKEDKERLIDDLSARLRIGGSGRDNLYTLSFRDDNPAMAKKVVQSLTSIFVESSLGGNRRDAENAKRFIEDQIKAYEEKLQEAENRVKEFKLKHMGVTASGRDYFTQMSALQEQIRQSQLELREAENSRQALQRQLAGEADASASLIPNVATEQSVPELDARIAQLNRELDGMLQRYTERHPDVVNTKLLIARLEKQRKEELAARQKAGGTAAPTPAAASAVYQQLKFALAESDARVASLRTRAGEYQSRYDELKRAAESVPQIEAEHTALNRDYEIHKRNYDALVSRRESATMSGELDSASGLADFRLIDPPRVSPKPVEPNRPLMLGGAFLLALGAGVAGALGVSQLRPTVDDVRGLRELTGLPVLGTVSLLPDPVRARSKRRRLMIFLAGLGSFVAAYAGVLAMLLWSIRTA